LFKAKADRFDLVITDMTMPNMTGEKLAKEMLEVKPGIPVILCSGYSARISQDQAQVMGIQAFVPKPILRSEIAAIIRKVLQEK
jgi:DNA-binding NtrC family response regulator